MTLGVDAGGGATGRASDGSVGAGGAAGGSGGRADDLLCSGGPFETLEAQCGPGRANESAPCYNRALASLQRTHESAAAAVNRDAGGERWTVLNLQGALQAAGGVAGTAIGRPDVSRYTPTRFYEPDCLHPNERGLRILTHAIVQRYFVCPEGPPCVRRKKGGRRRRRR